MVTIPRSGSVVAVIATALAAGALAVGAAIAVAPGSAPIVEPSLPHRTPITEPSPTVPDPVSTASSQAGATPPAQSVPATDPFDPSWCGPLSISITAAGGDAATGHREAEYRATNTGATACTLQGYPDVAIADASGAEVPVTVTHGSSFMTADPGPTVVGLAPGASAVALLGWDATDGRTLIGSVSIAACRGLIRTVIPADWDMTGATVLAVTAWSPDSPDLDPSA